MESIGVKNLRSLRDIGMVSIKPITVLVGKNSSGKSSFLRLFPLLKQTLEEKTAEPILWYGKYVDFGDYDLSKTHSEKGDIEFDFELKIPNMVQRYYVARSKETSKFMEATVSFGLKKQGLSSMKVFVKEQNFTLMFDSDSNIEKIEVNGETYSKNYLKNYSRGRLLPEIIMNYEEMDEIYRLSGIYDMSGALQAEIVKCLRKYANPKTKNETIGRGVSAALFGTPEEILKHLQDNSAFSDGMKAKLKCVRVDSVEFKKINNLVTLGTIPMIVRSICNSIESEIYAVRYSKPLRLNAERYRRIQGLAVDEVDPSGENLEMVLNNLSEREKKQFAEWTSEIFGFQFSTISKDGHVSVLVEDSRSHVKENLVDTGFGYSQVLPILLSVWKVDVSEKNSYGRNGHATKTACYYEAIEQPELHLHPALQAKLIDTFAQLVSRDNSQKIKFIMETHSETMINRLGYLIYKKKLDPEMVNIVIFDKDTDGNTKVTQTFFNEKGQLEKWPIGFFDPDEV